MDYHSSIGIYGRNSVSTSSEGVAKHDSAQQSLVGRYIKRLASSFPQLLALYAGSITLATLLFWWTEDYSLEDSFYWSFVTSLTIGYGDVSPKFLTGKLLVAFFGHIWVYFIGSLFIANILQRVLPNPHQFTHKEQEWIIAAILMIANALKLQLPPPPHDTDDGDIE